MTFVSPKTLLQRLGLRPKKSLGQHFLLHPHQARRIVAALDPEGRSFFNLNTPGDLTRAEAWLAGAGSLSDAAAAVEPSGAGPEY